MPPVEVLVVDPNPNPSHDPNPSPSPSLNPDPSQVLVVDEAAQATEPEALIPLGLEPRLMLVCGDPHQLSCTCTSRRAKASGLER